MAIAALLDCDLYNVYSLEGDERLIKRGCLARGKLTVPHHTKQQAELLILAVC